MKFNDAIPLFVRRTLRFSIHWMIELDMSHFKLYFTDYRREKTFNIYIKEHFCTKTKKTESVRIQVKKDISHKKSNY